MDRWNSNNNINNIEILMWEILKYIGDSYGAHGS